MGKAIFQGIATGFGLYIGAIIGHYLGMKTSIATLFGVILASLVWWRFEANKRRQK